MFIPIPLRSLTQATLPPAYDFELEEKVRLGERRKFCMYLRGSHLKSGALSLSLSAQSHPQILFSHTLRWSRTMKTPKPLPRSWPPKKRRLSRKCLFKYILSNNIPFVFPFFLPFIAPAPF
jgi:hypothetical protein